MNLTSASKAYAAQFVSRFLTRSTKPQDLNWLKSIAEQVVSSAVRSGSVWIDQRDVRDALIAAGFRLVPDSTGEGARVYVKARVRGDDVDRALRTGTLMGARS